MYDTEDHGLSYEDMERLERELKNRLRHKLELELERKLESESRSKLKQKLRKILEQELKRKLSPSIFCGFIRKWLDGKRIQFKDDDIFGFCYEKLFQTGCGDCAYHFNPGHENCPYKPKAQNNPDYQNQ